MFRRTFISPVVLGLAIAAVLSGCARRQSKVEEGDRTQVLHWGNLLEPADLDPATVTDSSTQNITMALFEGLTQYDAKTAAPVPGVASSWAVSADNLTWTFHLRPEAQWSNGDPLTADDFVYSIRRMLSPKLGAEYAYMFFALQNGEDYYLGKVKDPALIGAHAPDPHTLVLNLAHPVPYLPAMACHSAWNPVHQSNVEKFGQIDQRGSNWTRPGNLVSNGYFMLKEWKPYQYIRLVKNPHYWNRDHVRLNEVYFYPIENNEAEADSFRTEQLHVTATLPIAKIAVYRRDHPEFLDIKPFLSAYVYRVNVTKPPLNDVRVRRALAMSIDREQLVKDVTKGGQEPAGHFCPPDTAGFTAKSNVVSDVAAAQKLLAEAGFPGGKGFPHLEILFNTNEAHRSIAEAIQQMWRNNLGIDVGLYNQEGKVWNDSMRSGNYEIARFSWGGDYMDPSTFYDIMASDSGNNQTGWKNAEYDALLKEAGTTGDQAKRYALYQRCEQILTEECPLIPIYFYTRIRLRRPDVKGWYGNLLDFHRLDEVYLEKP